jgi:hypothetical protein
MLIYSNTGPATVSMHSQFWLGIGGTEPNYRRLQGAMDEVRLYNRALSKPELETLYNLDKP